MSDDDDLDHFVISLEDAADQALAGPPFRGVYGTPNAAEITRLKTQAAIERQLNERLNRALEWINNAAERGGESVC